MKTLLIPTDFSKVADNALKYALDMTREYQLDIRLFHVIQLSSLNIPHTSSNHDMEDFQNFAIQKMEHKIFEIRKEFPKITITYKIETGIFLDSFLQYIDEIRPVAIIMGFTGESILDKIIGTNTMFALKNINTPLIVVPKNCQFIPIQKICFACDLQNVVASTPFLAINVFAKLFNAEIKILNIDYHNRHFRPDSAKEIDILTKMLHKIEHSFHFIDHENIQDAIDEFIDNQEIDILIMTPKKYTFFESLFHKSHTKDIIFHSHVPILALHNN